MTLEVALAPTPTDLSGTRCAVVVRNCALGGAERQAVHLANGLAARCGAAVTFCTFNGGTGVRSLLAPEVATFLCHPGRSRIRPLKAAQLALFVLRLRARQPDVIIPFTDFPNKVLGALWRMTGARTCVWNQRDEGREITGGLLERRAIRQVSTFVANSESGRAHLENAFGVPGDRITTIPNGVELRTPQADRRTWREQLGINESSVVAVMVANLHRFKDHATLIQAWARLEPGPVLLLAGTRLDTADAIDRRRRELGLDDRVRLLGHIADVTGLLEASDLGVFSSYREGCPNGVLEAMAAGLPVVATDILGTREALGAAHPGLVPARDPAAFAAAVDRLGRDPGTRARLGRELRHRVKELFSVSSMIDSWAQLIARLLARAAR